MGQENGVVTFLTPSPPNVDIQDPNKRSKLSYSRDFLLSLAKADSTVKLPKEVELSISCVLQDSPLPGLLSQPSCVPDSRCQKSMPQNFPLKVPDNVNHLLHRSNEPYRPPCRYKALPPLIGDSNGLLNSDTSGSSECSNQEEEEPERWRKGQISSYVILHCLLRYKFKYSTLYEEKSCADTVKVAKEDKCTQNIDSKDSSEEFLITPATRNSNTLQFTSNVINKQVDYSWKPGLMEGAVRGNAVQPLTLPETRNPWKMSVNHIDTSWYLLPMLDNGMHLLESEEYSDLNEGHPEGTGHVMESLKKSRLTSFLNQENCGNLNKYGEVVHEQGIMESQVSNTSVRVHDSPGKIATSDLSEAYISPPVEEEKQFISMVDKCESAMIHCESSQDVKQAISLSMRQNPSSPDSQVQQELELNSVCNSLDGKSNSSPELCLPDEDSLITFDEPFLMPEVENSAVVDSFMSSPESNPNKSDMSSPSSPHDMIEKLIESILDDESSPVPHPDDPIAHHGAGLDNLCHPIHAQQSYIQFCCNQLIPGRDQQNHNSFQKNSIDSATFSFFSHSFPCNTISQPFPLSHDELRRFDHEVSQSTFQQFINPSKLHLGSACVSPSGVPPHLPALQMASCIQSLNSMQGCLEYQQPSYGFQKAKYSNIIQALVDTGILMWEVSSNRLSTTISSS
ncbi:hypothetical protein SESBI_41697 [Sesbania bispinosa]|nr:hypothetical protein SESBI_41697 [Sesbania bispinosa]